MGGGGEEVSVTGVGDAQGCNTPHDTHTTCPSAHISPTHLCTANKPSPFFSPPLPSPPLPSPPLPSSPLPSSPPLSSLIKLLTERKKLLEKLQSYRDKVAELKRQIAELKKASGTAEVGREVEQLISDKKDLQNKVCCVGRVCGCTVCVCARVRVCVYI